ncbi:MAG TPA: lantibiotic dehydratase [Kofleriaceae bacterium]|nr:lantibiotic dehydratase [Kofleriaceae bacterium]
MRSALKQIWHHRVPGPLADAAAEHARQQLGEAVAHQRARELALAEHHARAHRATSEALRRIGHDDRFRQAILWQNRSAVTTGIDWLLRQPVTATDSQTRKNERLVASYLQRYCVKNDTIGFFGPVGWARLVDHPAIAQRPGASLVASREVYYEYWAIDALAARLSEDPDLRPFIAPRLLPRFRVEGTTLHHPIERRAELPAGLAAVAARCDGVRTARELAREVSGDPALGLAGEAEVFGALEELAASKIIHWEIEIPTAVVHPDRHLAALLARVEDGEARRRAEAVLDELHRHRAAVAAASGAPELDAALAAFDAAFTRATETSSRRAHGRSYAGRTPLYEDCRRDLDLELGRPVLDRLAAPLELLLHSARWFTHEIAARYRSALAAIYRGLRGHGDPGVDFARFWQAVPALFPGGGAAGSIVAEVRDELHRRWAAALAVDRAERSVQRDAAALAGEIERAFAAPCPGWPAARHHSPDVMIAARGPDAIERGEYLIVIGELHTGFCTVAQPLFVKQHPHSDELIAARAADIPRVCIAPVWSKAVTRGDYYSLLPGDLDLEVGETRSARPRAQVVSGAQLVVEERDGALEVVTRDGARRFDVIAFLEHHLIAESFGAFSPVAPAPWTPRVTIDGVVIARETWRVAPAELAWPALEAPAARFVAARRWARSLGMPRWVFVKTPEEVKPVYVDFDSTIYVEMLAKQLRGASAAALSEMLPATEDAWIVDAAGERYTGELRIAAVDPEPWRPAAVDPAQLR